MRDKTPWYIYPPDEPKKHSGDDALGVLVGFMLVLIFVLVAIDHALHHVWMAALGWWDAFVLWAAEAFQYASGFWPF